MSRHVAGSRRSHRPPAVPKIVLHAAEGLENREIAIKLGTDRESVGLMGSELVRLGGVAASLLGKPRLTKDIDAVVMNAEAEALIESGVPYGFQPRIAGAVDFARNTRMLLLRFTEGGIDIDLSLGALPFENILQANPDLDVERIRRWVREFSAVLEMPEIHDGLEQLLRQRPR
jgi:hypothetical protein